MGDGEHNDVVSIIFQPNPSRDKVTYWLNAENRKRFMPRDQFYELVKSVQHSVLPKIMDACTTYSFYLWDIIDAQVVKLTYKNKKEEVLNPIGLYFNSVLSGKEVLSDQHENPTKPRSLEEYLMGFGFEIMDKSKLENLDVQFKNTAKEDKKKKFGFFRRRR